MTLFRPNDIHFADLKVEREYDQSLQTPKHRGMTRFFIKKYKGWTNDKGGATRYFGLEGADFTLSFKGKVDAVIDLLTAFKTVLPDADYKKLSPDAVKALQEAKFGVTTEPLIEEAKTGNRGNENVFTESDKELIITKAEAMAKAGKGGKMEWMPILMGVFAGVVIGIALVSFKVIKLA